MTNNILCFLLGLFISAFVCYKYMTNFLIEKRYKDLNITKYDSKVDKFIVKDSVMLKSGDLLYLINGTTKW